MTGMIVGLLVAIWMMLAFILAALARIEDAMTAAAGDNL